MLKSIQHSCPQQKWGGCFLPSLGLEAHLRCCGVFSQSSSLTSLSAAFLLLSFIPAEFGLWSADVKELLWLHLGEVGDSKFGSAAEAAVGEESEGWLWVVCLPPDPLRGLPGSALCPDNYISQSPLPFGSQTNGTLGRHWQKPGRRELERSQGVFMLPASNSVSFRGDFLCGRAPPDVPAPSVFQL